MVFHEAGYVHGDIHDGNIMMSKIDIEGAEDFHFKLIDYGLMRNEWPSEELKALAFKNEMNFFLETVLKIESRWMLSEE